MSESQQPTPDPTLPVTPPVWTPPSADNAPPVPTYSTGQASPAATPAHDPYHPPATPEYPTYPPVAGYPAAGYPTSGYPASGYPSTPGYGAYPGMPVTVQKNNGLAMAAMIVSIVGGALLFCYGAGFLFGLAGAIMGHIGRKQARTRGEAGDGMALAGIIVGWIVFAIGLIFAVGMVIFIVWASNQPDFDSGYTY